MSSATWKPCSHWPWKTRTAAWTWTPEAGDFCSGIPCVRASFTLGCPCSVARFLGLGFQRHRSVTNISDSSTAAARELKSWSAVPQAQHTHPVSSVGNVSGCSNASEGVDLRCACKLLYWAISGGSGFNVHTALLVSERTKKRNNTHRHTHTHRSDQQDTAQYNHNNTRHSTTTQNPSAISDHKRKRRKMRQKKKEMNGEMKEERAERAVERKWKTCGWHGRA